MERSRRRLAAIMCADAVHYARLMEADEVDTLERLKASRGVMAELTARHNGRIVNTWGDAVIIEFSSVVEAVQCATEIQNALAERNAGVLADRQMRFRIGINLGDVMVEGDDIFGDGVNVAARLQEMAPEGGILLSQSVHEQVRNKLALAFDRLGRLPVKNVSEPIETFAVRLGGRNEPVRPWPEQPPAPGDWAEHLPPAPIANPWRRRLEQALAWYRAQPRRVRSSLLMIGLFLALNLLTTGLSPLWFVWPSLPFAAAVAWHLLRGGERSDRPGER